MTNIQSCTLSAVAIVSLRIMYSGPHSYSLARSPFKIALLLFALVTASTLNGQSKKYPALETITPGIFLDSDYRFEATRGPLRPIPKSGVQLTKKSEGFRRYLYEDAVRYCTIAYGHLVKKARCDGSEPPEFTKGLSEPAGSDLLISDMNRVRQAVAALVKVDMTDGEYGAICDFVYNVGATNFSKSTLLDDINNRQTDEIPIQFRRWILANGKKLQALKVRREREIALFFGELRVPRAGRPTGQKVSPIDIRNGER